VGGNLSIKTFLNGRLVSNIIIDTSSQATDTIDYVATDSAVQQRRSPKLRCQNHSCIPVHKYQLPLSFLIPSSVGD
jgi:hypothetical protein